MNNKHSNRRATNTGPGHQKPNRNRRAATARIGKKHTNAGTLKGLRDVAYLVLEDHRKTGQHVNDLLYQNPAFLMLSPADKRLATDFVNGVVRRQATLDALIAPAIKRPRSNIEEGLWTFLRLGVYQLVFTDAIPAYAAISETVEAARQQGKAGWTGFLNGVLRSISRALTDEIADSPASHVVPLRDGKYRRVANPCFPDPERDPRGYVTSAFSFPKWLIDRWAARYPFEELCRLGFWFNVPPRTSLRINAMRTTRDEYLAVLHAAGMEALAGTNSESVLLSVTGRIEELPAYAQGGFAVQDESAMSAARLLDPQPGERVLDLCAAPGTKTTHLAELMRNEGEIVATDVDPRRLDRVRENCARMQVSIVNSQLIARDGSNVPPGPFDRILVDVPCSNTGVLGKRPEVRWRLQQKDLEELPILQERLLSLAFDRLKPGGRLVYSTCSIEPEENRDLVQRLVSRGGDHGIVQRISETEHRPGQPADGGYQALLTKSG